MSGKPTLDRPPVALLTGLVIGVLSICLAVALGAKEALWFFSSARMEEVDLGKEFTAYQEDRARDAAQLTQYDVIDPRDGVYQVPVDVAIHALVHAGTLKLP